VIEWSQRARSDIRDLKAYIAKDSPYYAQRFIERVIASVEKLEEFPKIGRPVPEVTYLQALQRHVIKKS
jgi:toxin ParE1/3/4